MFKIFSRQASTEKKSKVIPLPKELENRNLSISVQVSITPLVGTNIVKPEDVPQDYWDQCLMNLENALKDRYAGFHLKYDPSKNTCDIRYPNNVYDIPVPTNEA